MPEAGTTYIAWRIDEHGNEVVTCRHCGRSSMFVDDSGMWDFDYTRGNDDPTSAYCPQCQQEGNGRKKSYPNRLG